MARRSARADRPAFRHGRRPDGPGAAPGGGPCSHAPGPTAISFERTLFSSRGWFVVARGRLGHEAQAIAQPAVPPSDLSPWRGKPHDVPDHRSASSLPRPPAIAGASVDGSSSEPAEAGRGADRPGSALFALRFSSPIARRNRRSLAKGSDSGLIYRDTEGIRAAPPGFGSGGPPLPRQRGTGQRGWPGFRPRRTPPGCAGSNRRSWSMAPSAAAPRLGGRSTQREG